jgi:hypothetical protein
VLVALYESLPYDLEVAPMDFARLSINLTSVPVFGAIASSRSRNYNQSELVHRDDRIPVSDASNEGPAQ